MTGLWFEGQKYYPRSLSPACEGRGLPLFEAARRWLDQYFAGREPDIAVPLHFTGTAFQNEVWALLCEIPYGRTSTYGEIAARLAAKRGVPHLSAQAVGGAVGRNKISLLVPCHRVIGANGSLTAMQAAWTAKPASWPWNIPPRKAPRRDEGIPPYGCPGGRSRSGLARNIKFIRRGGIYPARGVCPIAGFPGAQCAPLHRVARQGWVRGWPQASRRFCLPCQREVARPKAVTEGLPYGWLPFKRSGMPVGVPCGGLSLE